MKGQPQFTGKSKLRRRRPEAAETDFNTKASDLRIEEIPE
jgi:hypothetical protein